MRHEFNTVFLTFSTWGGGGEAARPPQTLGNVWEYLWFSRLGRVFLAFGEWSPGTLLHTLQCRGWAPPQRVIQPSDSKGIVTPKHSTLLASFCLITVGSGLSIHCRPKLWPQCVGMRTLQRTKSDAFNMSIGEECLKDECLSENFWR